MDDTKYFNDAFMAYAERTGYAGTFGELPLCEQSLVIRDAQILKDAERIRKESNCFVFRTK